MKVRNFRRFPEARLVRVCGQVVKNESPKIVFYDEWRVLL